MEVKNQHHLHVCSLLDTFWYICFVIALCRLQYIPTINYYIILAIFSTFCSVFTQFLPITPTFLLTIFVYNYSLSSIFASLSTIFAIFLCHHCLHFYQDGMFVLDFSSRLCLFAVSLGQFLYWVILHVFVVDIFTKLFAWCLHFRISI